MVSPDRNSADPKIAISEAMLVVTPAMSASMSAWRSRDAAAARSAPCAITFASIGS